MNKQCKMNLESNAYSALRMVNFSERFKTISDTYNDFDNRMLKVKKSDVVIFLKKLGFDFKYIDGSFIFEEIIDDYKFVIIFDIKYGTFLGSFYLYYKGVLSNIQAGHFTFLRNYLDNVEEFIGPFYTSLNDLHEISKAVLSIYIDFKERFLKMVN